MREVILRNMAECKRCKDVIESVDTHDFVTCTCTALAVDGGKDYLRRSYVSAVDVVERSQVEYHPIAFWLAKRLSERIDRPLVGRLEKIQREGVATAIDAIVLNALRSESMHHIMGALNDLPEFASLSFGARDTIRKTIQRELTGEYK